MGKKLESNFTNMVVVLFSVTLIASAAVGYVYSLTAGPIEAAKQAKQVNAIREGSTTTRMPTFGKARPLTAENWNFIRRRKTEN